MERGKLIAIEGTDCSGKTTQFRKLVDRLKLENLNCEEFKFPVKKSPTGQIVYGPYLGSKDVCDGWFSEGAANVDPKVSALYYAADRRYNLPTVYNYLNNGRNLFLDRYVWSNMGHQGGKLHTPEEREQMYKWLETLEYKLLELPIPDLTFFLYMPYEYAEILKKGRNEVPDQHESSEEHLKNAELAYLELSKIYGFQRIDCVENCKIRTIDDIHDEVYSRTRKLL